MAKGATLAGALLLTMSALPATSGQTQYFMGDVWGVWQVLPDGGEGPEEKPRCMFGTRTWTHKGLNFMYVLTGLNYIEPQLQVYSENWELPVGEKTNVDLVTVAGPLNFELKAEGTNYLTGSLDPAVIGNDKAFALLGALSYLLDSRRSGISMSVKFAGNESEWPIPPMKQLETYRVKGAIDKCYADLKAKAADYFAKDGGQPNRKTSPFAQP
ncbi:hypothetical protein EDE09_101206 [Neorhizobium sp. S3-V5DH]|nr:hypothetical protein EDE09_101206 [Neorhizobium sp. S3-V5DH]